MTHVHHIKNAARMMMMTKRRGQPWMQPDKKWTLNDG